jgi:TM2 domain-containing membrane protein YozV/Tfp pilus assembly major pilin PilA
MADLVFCGACRKRIEPSATVCPHCNAPRIPGRRFKDRTSAALLAIFLGAFGAHRFYLGQWWGVFYLLFFWLGIPALVALIEGIVFLCGSQERWDEKHNDGVRTSTDNSRVVLLIALAAIFFIGIAMLGILAAIAIPAYADYTARTKVASALMAAQQATMRVQVYVEEQGALPASLAEAGFTAELPANVRSIELDESNGNVVVTMSGSPFDNTAFALSPVTDGGKGIIWRCGPIDILPRYLPRRCREAQD